MSFELKYKNYGTIDANPINLNWRIDENYGGFCNIYNNPNNVSFLGYSILDADGNLTYPVSLFVLGNAEKNKYIHACIRVEGGLYWHLAFYQSDNPRTINGNRLFMTSFATTTNLRDSFIKANLFMANIGDFFCICLSSTAINTPDINGFKAIGLTANYISDILTASPDGSMFSNEYGYPSNVGGYGGGSFDDSSDTIPIPNKPTLGVSSTGFINVYHTSLNALQNLGSELFPDIEDIIEPPTATEVADVLKETLFGINQSVSRIGSLITNSKLIDYIVDCHLLPVTPESGTLEKIKIGFKQFEVQGNKVLNDYIDFDCGSLSIAEYYQNFIDYVGTRAKLYLPFVGFVPIPNEYFQGGTLSVKYRFNVIDGSFMAYVVATSSKSQLTNTVIGSYGGNACVHIPITGTNYANMVSGLLNGTMGTLANAMCGNAVGTISSALSVMSNRPDMQSSNGYNSTSAFLGVRRPYLIIEREVSNFSQTYANEKGLPSNISKEICSLTGFVQMDNIHMDTLTCTDAEKEMIRQLLEDGVIV